MNYSRRDLHRLLPALALVAGRAADNKELPSKALRFEDLPVRSNGHTRSVFDGETHSGFRLELHETELPAGEAPHPPHHHVHEECLMLREGTLEVMISGKKSTVGPGSVVYVASNEEHGWKNVGTTPVNYFVIALGKD